MTILSAKTIVLADSENARSLTIAAEFQSAGAQVEIFSGGFEAYEFARTKPVDAVLTSPDLKSGDPYQVLSDMRRLKHDMPVLFFGAKPPAFTPAEAFHRGFVAFYPEAYPVSVLLEATARSLEFVEVRKKQKVERVSVAAQAEITYGQPARTKRVPVLNISRGGLFLSMDSDFPEAMSSLHFRLFLGAEDEPKVEGEALVRWVRQQPAGGHLAGIGIEFGKLLGEQRKFVDEYVERASRRS